jgi:hypothetical protein
MWLTKLKIAIVTKDTDSLSELIKDIPELSSKEDLEQASYLTKEAVELLKTFQADTKNSMAKIKKNLAFLRSTEVPISRKLDLTS